MSKASWCLVAFFCLAARVQAEEATFRYTAAIVVERPAAFVRMRLPASAYAHSLQPGLDDLRVVDAHGERMPFAFVPHRFESKAEQRPVTLFPLPAQPSGEKWVSPVEMTVDGDRITVKRTSGRATPLDPVHSPGWLLDLGERHPSDPLPQSLTLQWSGPAQFSVELDYDMSDDLRSWRYGGRGQLMALASTSGPLTQPNIVLPANPGRFLRLVWSDAEGAPVLSGGWANLARQLESAEDAPSELRFAASPEPTGKRPLDATSKRALHFDLGAALPLSHINLQLAAGTRVAPVCIEGRRRVDDPWRNLAQSVFYRLERDGVVTTAPPLALDAVVRFIRVIPDERSSALDAKQTVLLVRSDLARLVFSAQGQAPYALFAGSPDATAGALPVGTVVPSLDSERSRFGAATLGAWTEVVAVVRQVEEEQRRAALRPWLLWSVLLAGVAGLGFMVWRMAKKGSDKLSA